MKAAHRVTAVLGLGALLFLQRRGRAANVRPAAAAGRPAAGHRRREAEPRDSRGQTGQRDADRARRFHGQRVCRAAGPAHDGVRAERRPVRQLARSQQHHGACATRTTTACSKRASVYAQGDAARGPRGGAGAPAPAGGQRGAGAAAPARRPAVNPAINGADPRRIRTRLRTAAGVQQPRARHGGRAVRDGVP